MRRQKKIHKGNLVCAYCGSKYLDSNMNNPFRKRNRKSATIDHILAQTNGGSKYDEKNMCVCCSDCNNKKKDMSVVEFLKKRGLTSPFNYINNFLASGINLSTLSIYPLSGQ